MRALSVYVAVLGAIGWLLLSLGGYGGLIYVRLLAESVVGRDLGWVVVPLWLLFAVLVVLWWVGIVAVVLNCGAFLHWIGELPDRMPLTIGEWMITVGHVFLLSAGTNALLFPSLLDTEFVYGFLILAALGYGAGLLRSTLTARSSRTPANGNSPPLRT